jgi:hypothetical protein
MAELTIIEEAPSLVISPNVNETLMIDQTDINLTIEEAVTTLTVVEDLDQDVFLDTFGYISGSWYGVASNHENAGGGLANGSLLLAPWYVFKTNTWDQIGINHWANVGDAGSVIKPCIYKVTSFGAWSLIAEASIPLDTGINRKNAGFVGGNKTLSPGSYMLGGVVQGITTPVPNISRIVNAPNAGFAGYLIPRGYNSNFTLLPRGFARAGITGALPATITPVRADFENSGEYPYVWVRAL